MQLAPSHDTYMHTPMAVDDGLAWKPLDSVVAAAFSLVLFWLQLSHQALWLEPQNTCSSGCSKTNYYLTNKLANVEICWEWFISHRANLIKMSPICDPQFKLRGSAWHSGDPHDPLSKSTLDFQGSKTRQAHLVVCLTGLTWQTHLWHGTLSWIHWPCALPSWATCSHSWPRGGPGSKPWEIRTC